MSSLLNSIDFQYVIGALVKIAVFWIFIMLVVAYTVYAERRVLAVIQNRLGPNRVGWQGLLQPFALNLSPLRFYNFSSVPALAARTMFSAARNARA